MGSLSTLTASRSNIIIAAGATLVAASLGFGLLALTQSSSKETSTKTTNSTTESRALTTVTEIDDDAEDVTEDYITENDIVKVFDQLYAELQSAFSQLMNQVQQMQMSGQRLPEQQLQLILKQELERALRTKQGPIIEMANMDIDCFEEATWEYLNPNVSTGGGGTGRARAAVEKLQKLWQTATGEHVVGWTPFHELEVVEPLDPEATIQAATVFFQAVTDCMRRLISEYEVSGKDLRNDAVAQQLNIDFSNQANDAGETALQSLGYTQAQFETSVTAHQSDPTVARALTTLGMQQQQAFATMRS